MADDSYRQYMIPKLGLPIFEWAILYHVAGHDGGRGCWASYQTIADLVGCSKGAVIKYLQKLIDDGWLLEPNPRREKSYDSRHVYVNRAKVAKGHLVTTKVTTKPLRLPYDQIGHDMTSKVTTQPQRSPDSTKVSKEVSKESSSEPSTESSSSSETLPQITSHLRENGATAQEDDEDREWEIKFQNAFRFRNGYSPPPKVIEAYRPYPVDYIVYTWDNASEKVRHHTRWAKSISDDFVPAIDYANEESRTERLLRQRDRRDRNGKNRMRDPRRHLRRQ